MPLYVDDTLRNKHGYPRCWLMADTLDELHYEAKMLGKKEAWFVATSVPHYELSPYERMCAIRRGAIEVNAEGIIRLSDSWKGRPFYEAEKPLGRPQLGAAPLVRESTSEG